MCALGGLSCGGRSILEVEDEVGVRTADTPSEGCDPASVGPSCPPQVTEPDPSCPSNQILCEGKCIVPADDENFCGASGDCQNGNAGSSCPAQHQCVGGACQLVCAAGETICGDACVNLSFDPAHCGSCEDGCVPGEACADGACELLAYAWERAETTPTSGAYLLDVAASEDGEIAALMDGNTWKRIEVMLYTPDTEQWGPPDLLSSGEASGGALAVSGERFYAAFHEKVSSGYRVRLRSRGPEDAAWDDTIIAESPSRIYTVDIEANSQGDVAVSWRESDVGGMHVTYRRSGDEAFLSSGVFFPNATGVIGLDTVKWDPAGGLLALTPSKDALLGRYLSPNTDTWGEEHTSPSETNRTHVSSAMDSSGRMAITWGSGSVVEVHSRAAGSAGTWQPRQEIATPGFARSETCTAFDTEGQLLVAFRGREAYLDDDKLYLVRSEEGVMQEAELHDSSGEAYGCAFATNSFGGGLFAWKRNVNSGWEFVVQVRSSRDGEFGEPVELERIDYVATHRAFAVADDHGRGAVLWMGNGLHAYHYR